MTGLVEVGRRKCHQYWPSEKSKPIEYGSFKLELLEEQAQAHYTVRNLRLTLGNESRLIKQMQYHSWPDHGVPGKLCYSYNNY